MKADEPAPQEARCQRSFVAEVLHNLSQPLTALHCSLELALYRDQTLEDLRSSVEIALETAERLRQRLVMVSRLNDATDPGDTTQITDLNALFGELREDMLPLFESVEKTFELKVTSGQVQVRADQLKLKSALFSFLEYLFRYSPQGSALVIDLRAGDRQRAEINISTTASLPVAHSATNIGPSHCACEIEIVHRTFRAARGTFALLSSASGHDVWVAKLPLA